MEDLWRLEEVKSEEEDVAKDFHRELPSENIHIHKNLPHQVLLLSIFSENPLDTFCRVMILR